jgi:hypothetical protein
VSEGKLAAVWLVKLIGCTRARAALTAMNEADDIVDREVR